jgi:hypothetical protein
VVCIHSHVCLKYNMTAKYNNSVSIICPAIGFELATSKIKP